MNFRFAKTVFVSSVTIMRLVLMVILIIDVHYLGRTHVYWQTGLWIGVILSDLIDGTLARWLKVDSTFGALLDASVDKFVMVSTALLLWVHRDLPLWIMLFVLLVVCVAIYQATMFKRERGDMPQTRLSGKVATAAWALFAIPFFAGASQFGTRSFFLPAFLTFFAAFDYGKEYGWRWWTR